jgi:hypothetical protein
MTTRKAEIPDEFGPDKGYWFNAREKGKEDPEGSEVADALIKCATDRETAQTARRWQNYVFARLMSGRPSHGTFAYGMAKRPSSFFTYYEQFEFGAPKSGLSSLLGDTYVNRLLSHRTYIDQVPDQGDLYQQRKQAHQLAMWTDGGFNETRYWEKWKATGVDAIWYGTGVIWFEGNDETKAIEPETVHMDEVLFANVEIPFNDQKEVIRRRYVSRYSLWAKHKNDPDAAAAILAAPSAHRAFYFEAGQLNLDDVIPLVIGVKCSAVDGEKGRYTEAVKGYALVDREYEWDTLPCEAFHFTEIPGSTWGQGLAEQTLQFTEWLDELLSVAHESDLRAGRGKWFADELSNVNADDLSDVIANVVFHAGPRPVFEAPNAVSPSLMLRAQQIIEMAMSRVHVSQMAVKGEVPKQLTAAVAIEKYAQIEDSNFNEALNRVEEFTRRSGLQYIRLGKTLKPKYVYSGRTKQLIDWPNLEMKGDQPLNITAYCSGRFGQTMAGKLQKLQQLRQQGDISRQKYLRYLEIPSTDALLDGINARTDLVDEILDQLVFGDDYVPPPAFCDMEYAIAATEDRYSLEAQSDMGTPAEVLDRLTMFRAHLIELRDQSSPDAENNLAPAGTPTYVGAPGGAPGGAPLLPTDTGSGLPVAALNPTATSTGLPAPEIPIPPNA